VRVMRNSLAGSSKNAASLPQLLLTDWLLSEASSVESSMDTRPVNVLSYYIFAVKSGGALNECH